MRVAVTVDGREPTPRRMYGCIEGNGPELAATLYEAYPPVSSLLGASEAKPARLERIGESRGGDPRRASGHRGRSIALERGSPRAPSG